ncbi:MAG: ArsR family transcriptional regulator [Candidatus Parvarchaeota archaeon]|nr:ArsR family transcriptional regulator [Candidatus Jingweiarchaeum tengchongense]MCW1298519.1 ArsR family transcriptional regulator [Candidatus Jingweiarchaeum tengchongense]MCW1300235.1 ArsR family transcriptional regulator [Candidatus Jingweiarchaeum tengchongense]MCW1304531.1 ArsR family transcriptional regulator [Candidatus Jingweiarchaeum tengchongense]MCW1305741.1 ArsR family transcriptional regulator [Candidatus Jingweiarchaeum tengchongense]
MKVIISDEKNKTYAKDILLFSDPEALKPILNPIRWKILKLLASKPMYPAEIAKILKMHEQKVYFHIKQLKNSGLISIERKEEKKGGIAKFYKVSSYAFGLEIPGGEKKIPPLSIPRINEKLREFLSPFVKDSELNCKIVVGSPDPHGPFKASARDGHYGIYLGIFLGQICNLPKEFAIKLDVDIKAEKEEQNNLILIGGPGTNILTAEMNKYLPIKFDEQNYWKGIVSEKSVYTAESCGVIARIRNPFNKENKILVLAGLRAIGTKACVLGITRFYKDVLKNYQNDEDFACVIQGFDLDGDGKIDSVELLESV